MRTADKRLSKNVNNIPNGKLINILTEKYLKRGGSRAGRFYQRKNGGLVNVEIYSLRVLKITKRPRMKYGKGSNKGTLKVHRKCGTATVKLRLHSTKLVRSRKTCFIMYLK